MLCVKNSPRWVYALLFSCPEPPISRFFPWNFVHLLLLAIRYTRITVDEFRVTTFAWGSKMGFGEPFPTRQIRRLKRGHFLTFRKVGSSILLHILVKSRKNHRYVEERDLGMCTKFHWKGVGGWGSAAFPVLDLKRCAHDSTLSFIVRCVSLSIGFQKHAANSRCSVCTNC